MSGGKSSIKSDVCVFLDEIGALEKRACAEINFIRSKELSVVHEI